jgi:hypothetical protein
MIDASLVARMATGDSGYYENAELAFDWFFGGNTARAPLVANGGCCDGIDPHSVNPNMGAESTLAYLQSAMAMAVATPVAAAARLQIVR